MEGFLQSFGNNFVSKDGTDSGSSLQSAQLIGIYFSAHWCPPCRNFTPVLAKFYNDVNASGKVFEIVFASSDQDEHSFKEYLSTMPWIAIKFGASEIQNLKTKFVVSGIPRLVILKPDGTVVVDNARTEVTNKGVKAWSDWTAAKKEVIDPLVWKNITTSGQEVKAVTHQHNLKYVDYTSKTNPGYSSGWSCNECSKYGPPAEKNWYCDACSYDVCAECFQLEP